MRNDNKYNEYKKSGLIKPKEEMTLQDYRVLGLTIIGDKKHEFKEKIKKIFKRKKNK